MTLGHGKDCDVHMNGRDMTAYLKNADLQMSAEANETTTMGAGTVTRIGGLLDSKLSLDGLYDSATNAIYDLVRAALATAADAILAVWPLGDTAVNALGFGIRGRETDHATDMPNANVLVTSASFEGDGDVEELLSQHPLAAETTAGNGSAIDGGAATTAGGAVYVQCTAFTGTSITLTLEDSTDGASGWATIATLTAITAGGSSERVAIAGNIKRYTRVVRAGTFTTATFSMGLYRA